MTSKAAGRALAACVIAVPVAVGAGAPAAQAVNGDTHVQGQGINETIDCNQATLIVNGTANTVYALGSCFAVTLQGSYNVVIADNVTNNILVYGDNQTVFYKSGDPVIWDRGRELGMTNRIDRVPA